ncbi:tetratricopeptide repeat protein [Archangium violaceum]|uniref:tetratricopeptide repeat protein n=1 Tax=Archangium violaceum TaxID=83451 RepID=UPI001951BFB5|nr:tetratricopeptide repeat protein [Archangium violaceum]QRN98503.1 tetratricopeptide repeat protein [Archangium violaceum]
MSDEVPEGTDGPASGLQDETSTLLRLPINQDKAATLPLAAMTEEMFPALASGRLLVGRYTVLDILGQGGMGLVLAAYDARLDRRVALKVLRSRKDWEDGGEREARLVREAQAMARLSHPHVVSVYDAGSLEDGSVFIAMEYVEGTTLRRWGEQRSRSWREVLEAFLAAGRGLAAAHAVGLVHRDFKPENVLVGKDGRVRVTDFGLARVGAASLPTGRVPVSPPEGGSSSVLTQPGTLMGTLRYMAPELLQGARADVRSDLFAFCVSLYEALYGQAPFAGDTQSERARAQEEGRVTPPPKGSEVPAWVERTVLRGLRADPGERHASMEELLTALADDPEVRRRSWRLNAVMGGLVAVVLVGLASGGWVFLQRQGQVCGRMETRLAGIWDEDVRSKVRESLLGTGLTYARDTSERVSVLLDDYAGEWVKQRTEVCEAARQEGPAQPRSLTVLREYCLERRRGQLRGFTELLGRGPDRELVDKAVQAALALPSLDSCADVKALTMAVPPPEDAVVRARAQVLQEQVDLLETLGNAARYKEGLALGEELLRQVESVGHAPLHAHTLFQVAALQKGAGDYKGAEARMRQSIAMAARGKDFELLAKAWSQLLFIVGYHQGRHQEALELELVVEAAVDVADDALTRVSSLLAHGHVLMQMGRSEEARARFERALALGEKTLGPEHRSVFIALDNLGLLLMTMGRNEEARAKLERALVLREKALGPEHPDMGYALESLSTVLLIMRKYEEAEEKSTRALALKEKALGSEHLEVAQSLSTLGSVLMMMGRYEEARQKHERALALSEKTLGPEHPHITMPLFNLGVVLEKMGRYEEARETFERALAVHVKAQGPEHPKTAYALTRLGNVLVALKRYGDAREKFERALALRKKVLGPEHPELALPLLGLARLAQLRGKPSEAISLIERALGLAVGESLAEAQLALARALWDSKQDRSRAVQLATQSREYWERIGDASKLAESSQWLAIHASP